MHLAYLAKAIRFIHFAHLADAIIGVALVGHIGDNFIFILSLTQRARLPDIMGQWLLGADVNASFHASERGIEVRVVRGIDADAVNLFAQLVEHHAEIIKSWNRPSPCPSLPPRKLPSINVTQRDDILALGAVIRHTGNITGTDVCEIQLTIRGRAGLANRESR